MSAVPGPSPAMQQWRAAVSRAVHPSNRGSNSWIWDAASGLAAIAVPWDLSGQPDERVGEVLVATETYDVWLVHWPPGSELLAHDHSTSMTAFCVVEGALDEERHERGNVIVARFGPGEGRVIAEGAVHALRNATTGVTTTVHVYTPPFAHLRFAS